MAAEMKSETLQRANKCRQGESCRFNAARTLPLLPKLNRACVPPKDVAGWDLCPHPWHQQNLRVLSAERERAAFWRPVPFNWLVDFFINLLFTTDHNVTSIAYLPLPCSVMPFRH
eukprot:2129735-Rhodomonas_salina.2